MKRFFAILTFVVSLTGCTWDDMVAVDKWLDTKVKVGNPLEGPTSHKALYENSIEKPYMTPIN